MKVLVCGGAGYIGSHLVREILQGPYQVIIYDNLSKGNPYPTHHRKRTQGIYSRGS